MGFQSKQNKSTSHTRRTHTHKTHTHTDGQRGAGLKIKTRRYFVLFALLATFFGQCFLLRTRLSTRYILCSLDLWMDDLFVNLCCCYYV